jgi:hypothetical protein
LKREKSVARTEKGMEVESALPTRKIEAAVWLVENDWRNESGKARYK